MSRTVSGTYEWAVDSVNCSVGCINDCHYCYAKRLSILRKDFTTYKDWSKHIGIRRKEPKEHKKFDGTVMFPSTHDIFPENLELCCEVIANLLEARNTVLIVSKPRVSCISRILKEFEDYKDKILFRFTIGCSDDRILKTWEPGAPDFAERFACLVLAHENGFKTSVSMEPMLDSSNVIKDFNKLSPYVTDSIWIGKMNRISDRVTGIPVAEKKRIREGQTDSKIIKIYGALKDEPKVKWKESFKKVLGLDIPTEVGTDK